MTNINALKVTSAFRYYGNALVKDIAEILLLNNYTVTNISAGHLRTSTVGSHSTVYQDNGDVMVVKTARAMVKMKTCAIVRKENLSVL